MDFAIGFETFLNIVGSLVGFVALLYINSARRELDRVREENKELRDELSEIKGHLASTREDMVRRGEFNGAVNRLYIEINKVGKHVSLLIAQLSGNQSIGRRIGDNHGDYS